ncbi:putative toxin-antitoxin system toxin component, PIN family [Methylobacterium sp. M6A4_1b]
MIVVDANVVLGALRSRNGASHVVLRGLLARRFSFGLSPAMVLEYEEVLKRPGLLGPAPGIDEAGIDAILDALCATAVLTLPWFRAVPG